MIHEQVIIIMILIHVYQSSPLSVSVDRRFGRLPWWSSARWISGRRGRFIVTSPTTVSRLSPACRPGRWPKWTKSSVTPVTQTSNRPPRERWVYLVFIYLLNDIFEGFSVQKGSWISFSLRWYFGCWIPPSRLRIPTAWGFRVSCS